MIHFKTQPNSEKDTINLMGPLFKQWFFSKFQALSEPQKYSILDIHSRKNILVSASTGSGKTLCAFSSIINELIDLSQKKKLEDRVYCVYVSPLRALSRDIQVNLLEPLQEMQNLNKEELGMRVLVRTGDTTPAEKSKMLKTPPHILITTPESLALMLSSPKFKEHLKDVQWCVVDEVHALAENKRGTDLSISLERLNRVSPAMTRIGLSATVAPLEDVAKFLVGSNRDCEVVDIPAIKELDLKVISPVKNLIDTSFEDMHNSTYSLLDQLIQTHKTTLIFTNTRSATERVVHHLKEKYPKNYSENIGAHHGSLSRKHRTELETRLRKGELKSVVCSTSLELGIDIGYIDLVILLGSPKSVARALQRVGRSGHKLHDTTKGRIIVQDRDDLVECSVILKSAMERKIDRIHIPRNALDVLAQQIAGIAVEDSIHIDDLFKLITDAYPYKDLDRVDFNEVISFLSGEFSALEDRHVYSRIWYNKETGFIGRKGRLARVIYMTNIGTIPDQQGIIVKQGDVPIGTIDESFLERLKRGDRFVLGGNVYQFQSTAGMVARVTASTGKPTVPSWFSDMLPLSFDLAQEISRFRRLIEERFNQGQSREDVISFINEFLYLDENATNSIYEYFRDQYDYAKIPGDKKILIEHYLEEGKRYTVFHTMLGRRVNDCLSRAVAFVISKMQKRDVELGVTDNGFYVASEKPVQAVRAFDILRSDKLEDVLEGALERTVVLSRRFRHCAGRSLMILRNYKGRKKRAGKQQVSSMILLKAVKRISNNFCILREARREVLEDLMDIENAKRILLDIEEGRIKFDELHTDVPSPFAFNLVLQGHVDALKMEDKIEFLKRMQQMVKAKISLNR
ncbi:ATP-dependent helicase [Nanoarchaeota archaeon]